MQNRINRLFLHRIIHGFIHNSPTFNNVTQSTGPLLYTNAVNSLITFPIHTTLSVYDTVSPVCNPSNIGTSHAITVMNSLHWEWGRLY